MRQAAGKAFMQLRDRLQLLPPNLAGAVYIPGLDLRLLRLPRVGLPPAAGRPHHGIDLFLIQFVLHSKPFTRSFLLAHCNVATAPRPALFAPPV